MPSSDSTLSAEFFAGRASNHQAVVPPSKGCGQVVSKLMEVPRWRPKQSPLFQDKLLDSAMYALKEDTQARKIKAGGDVLARMILSKWPCRIPVTK